MILELKEVMLSDDEVPPFFYEMSFSSITTNGFYPFVSPVAVTGTVQSHAGSVKLDAWVFFNFGVPCDRCTIGFRTHYDLSFSRIAVSSLTDGDNDLYIVAEEYRPDLDTLLWEDILLELPTRFLCSPDCKGLCPQCGQNLSQGMCRCISQQTDPRLTVLKRLTDQSKDIGKC